MCERQSTCCHHKSCGNVLTCSGGRVKILLSSWAVKIWAAYETDEHIKLCPSTHPPGNSIKNLYSRLNILLQNIENLKLEIPVYCAQHMRNF